MQLVSIKTYFEQLLHCALVIRQLTSLQPRLDIHVEPGRMVTISAPIHHANRATRTFALTVKPEITSSLSFLNPKSSRARPTLIA
ncbi:hypothetical protein [Nostoc sp. UIC 10630]|uniref:hypothetical protein n=1 Tax=Nostoc sp. UIC 10630 TaxID=2100146 RepID=UPI001931E319|nr:hypothetical protein [Nostoc sp. UIC 10630]